LKAPRWKIWETPTNPFA